MVENPIEEKIIADEKTEEVAVEEETTGSEEPLPNETPEQKEEDVLKQMVLVELQSSGKLFPTFRTA